MEPKINGSQIDNATIILHEPVKSAAYFGEYVELYGKEYTVRVNLLGETKWWAKQIFKHFGVEWHYDQPETLADVHKDPER